MNWDIVDGSNQISSDDRSRNSQSDNDGLHSLNKNLFESIKQIFSKCENVRDDVQRQIYNQFMTFHNSEVNELIINHDEKIMASVRKNVSEIQNLLLEKKQVHALLHEIEKKKKEAAREEDKTKIENLRLEEEIRALLHKIKKKKEAEREENEVNKEKLKTIQEKENEKKIKILEAKNLLAERKELLNKMILENTYLKSKIDN